MAFWKDAAASPKLSYQWILTLGVSAIQTYSLRSFQKPSFDVGVSEYKDINDVRYKPGILVWKPIEISFVDGQGEGNNVSSILNMIYTQGGYRMGAKGFPKQGISKQTATMGLVQPLFSQLNADNKVIDTWLLHKAFISNIDFGLATYEGDEAMVVRMTLIYDYATYERKL